MTGGRADYLAHYKADDALRRIIEDSVDSVLRWNNPVGRNPRDIGYEVADDVMRRLEHARIIPVSA